MCLFSLLFFVDLALYPFYLEREKKKLERNKPLCHIIEISVFEFHPTDEFGECVRVLRVRKAVELYFINECFMYNKFVQLDHHAVPMSSHENCSHFARSHTDESTRIKFGIPLMWAILSAEKDMERSTENKKKMLLFYLGHLPQNANQCFDLDFRAFL